MLLTCGIVMVYSASAAIGARENAKAVAREEAKSPVKAPPPNPEDISVHSFKYLKRQAIWAVLSILALLVTYHIDYEKYKRYATPFLACSFLGLLLVYAPIIGQSHKGSHRWIGIGGVQLQASELAKLSLIIYMAKKLCDRHSEVRSFARGFFPSMLILATFMGVIVIEPDLGTCIVIGLIMFIMWYVGGMRIIHLSTLGILAIPGVIGAIIAEPYRVRRMIAFLNPESDVHDTGWHLYQSLISVGSGGMWGVGLGKGPQKYLFLSEAHTDFIFGVICEELGLVGALCLIALYVFFMFQGIRVASRAPDLYGCLLATGITCMIGVQSFINMAVVIGLLPTKGLTLPLISYGGSSLLINMAAVGILMNISRYAEIASNPSRRPRPVYA